MLQKQIHLPGPDLAQELVRVFSKHGVDVESSISENICKINQMLCYLTYHNWPLEEYDQKHPGRYFFNINDSSLQDDRLAWLLFIGGRNITRQKRRGLLGKGMEAAGIPNIIEHVIFLSWEDFIVFTQDIPPDGMRRYKFNFQCECVWEWLNIRLYISGAPDADIEIDREELRNRVFVNDFDVCLEIDSLRHQAILQELTDASRIQRAIQLLSLS